jgi:type I restriction enzyme R subunit
VTADDGKLGEQHLREFQDNEKRLPTILTTSQKLSTGVDALNVRNIVLMRPIKSMIEFKQIIGRGTRVFDGKYFFTIYDFVKAHEHFRDPKWDGEPEPPAATTEPYPEAPEPRPPGEAAEDGKPYGDEEERPEKIVIKLADGKARQIRYLATTSYWSHDGTPITAQQFMAQLFGDLQGLIESEEQLRAIWSDPDQREHFIERLAEMDYDHDRLDDMRRLIDAPDSDIFDVLAYVRFTLAPLARRERAEQACATGLNGYEPEMRGFLEYILRAYEMHGVEELAPRKIPDFLRIRYGGTNDAKRVLGSAADIRSAFVSIQSHLFQSRPNEFGSCANRSCRNQGHAEPRIN